jgi:membrane protein CcdC involved in cytochrome C biogenesis
MRRTVSATLIVALPLAGLLWLSGAVSIHAAVGAMMLLVFIVLSAGFLLLRAAGCGDMPAPAAWVLGLFASAVAVYALVAWLDLRAITAFAIWASSVVGLGVFFGERAQLPQHVEGKEFVGLLLCGVSTVMWCRDVAEAPAWLIREQLLPAWIDYFIHGGVISQFGDPRAIRGSIYLADYAPLRYHYASYMLPAALAGLLDQPGLPLGTSAWLPLGFFTMCAGAYALGAALGGAAGGIAGIAVLALVPDPSNYGLRNGFLGFHWHMLATPGASYVIGVLLVCAALLRRWSPGSSVRPLLGSAVLVTGSVLFRVHVFAIGVPAWLVTAVLAMRPVRERKLLFYGVAFLGFLLFVIAFYAATDSDVALEIFLAAIHNVQEPTAYRGWYAALLEAQGPVVAIPVGILLVYAACLGIFVVLYPITVFVVRRLGIIQRFDAFPAFVIVTYLLLMLTAPIAQHRDSTELTVRPFVLVYAVIAVWTVAMLVRACAHRWEDGDERSWRVLVAASLLAVPLVWPQTGAMGRLPKFFWGWQYYTYKVEPGLTEAAAFLRKHSRPGEVFAMRGLRLGWAATDHGIQVTSLSGMPAYFSYAIAHTLEGGERGKAALQRFGELARIDRAESAARAIEELRRLRVSWYVVIGREGPPWDRERRHAVFVEQRAAVYAIPDR